MQEGKHEATKLSLLSQIAENLPSVTRSFTIVLEVVGLDDGRTFSLAPPKCTDMCVLSPPKHNGCSLDAARRGVSNDHPKNRIDGEIRNIQQRTC